ncbi:MAG: DNA-processing protein DprA [Candidatus Glassbacteria bacterium]
MKGNREDCLLRISLALGTRQNTIREILLSVNDPQKLIDEGARYQLPVYGEVIESINRVREDDVVRMRESMDEDGIGVLSILDEGYPPLLKSIIDPPGILFVKGQSEIISRPSVCMVGSRIATMEGMSIAEIIAGDLAREGLVVVSGLARGIDQAAHRGALNVGGKTTAILGCGPDIMYPRVCRREYGRVAREGAILSEFPPGTEPRRAYFPRRNRIMSGMSMGVVVVEAAARSGALITSNYALEEGREVFAVPGSPLNPLSRGTNGLIKQGAIPVETGNDVIEALKLSGWLRKRKLGSEGCGDFMKLLQGGPKSIDELARLTGREASQLLSELLEMEVNGNVERLPGMRYVCRG